jgi:DNA-binding beta-propeller fold protein YncE
MPAPVQARPAPVQASFPRLGSEQRTWSMSRTTRPTVQVIDPSTFAVIATYPTGREPQHVVASWDMKTLWVNDDLGNDMVPIDPVTGKPGTRVPVEDPYNLYFTPDGTQALVMAERMHRIEVHNPQTMAFSGLCQCPVTASTTPTTPRTCHSSLPAASSAASVSWLTAMPPGSSA